jgi:hypothetical protein
MSWLIGLFVLGGQRDISWRRLPGLTEEQRVLTLVFSSWTAKERQREKNVSLHSKQSKRASMQAGYTKSFSLLWAQLQFPYCKFITYTSMERGHHSHMIAFCL